MVTWKRPKWLIIHHMRQAFEVSSERFMALPSGGDPPDFQYRYYSWGQVDAGDCHQINGSLMFRSDGVGTFDAVVWTDHTSSGDVWHSTFSVSDDDNIYLFTINEISSPTTSGAHVSMHGQFNFPADKFGSLPTMHGVTQNGSC